MFPQFEEPTDEKSYFVRGLWLPLAFALGCAAYFTLPTEPELIIYTVLSGLPALMVLLLRLVAFDALSLRQFLVLLNVWFLVGFGYSDFRTGLVAPEPVRAPLDKVMVEGWIDGIERDGSRERLTLKVHSISGIEGTATPEKVRLTLRKTSEFRPGRFVRCFASVKPPPEPALRGEYEFAREAYFKGLGGVGFAFGTCRPGVLQAPEGPVQDLLNGINQKRINIAQLIAETGGEGGGLAAALLTGDRSYIPEDQQETLRASGLAHLLAISGLHMGLAGGALYFLFFRGLALVSPLSKRMPVQKIAAVFALIGITAYLMLSGASISAQRAYIMVLFAFLAVIFDMPVISFQTLGLSLLGVLLISPSAVVTPGFQMSFSAAGALIRAYTGPEFKHLGNRLPLPAVIRNFLAPLFLTSIVAGLATAPFAIFHFGRFATYGIMANLFVMPLVTVLCVPLAILSVIGMMAGLSELPIQWFARSLELIVQIASRFVTDGYAARFPQEQPLTAFPFMMMAGALMFWILSLSTRWLLIGSMLTIALVTWAMHPSFDVVRTSSNHLAVKTDSGWAVVKLKDAGLQPLSFSKFPEIECKGGCEIAVEHAIVKISSDGGVKIHTPQDGQIALPDFDSYGVALNTGAPIMKDLSYRPCRPWSQNWPQCKS